MMLFLIHRIRDLTCKDDRISVLATKRTIFQITLAQVIQAVSIKFKTLVIMEISVVHIKVATVSKLKWW